MNSRQEILKAIVTQTVRPTNFLKLILVVKRLLSIEISKLSKSPRIRTSDLGVYENEKKASNGLDEEYELHTKSSTI